MNLNYKVITPEAMAILPSGRSSSGDVPQEVVDSVLKAVVAGKRQKAIAEFVGVSESLVHSWVQLARQRVQAKKEAGEALVDWEEGLLNYTRRVRGARAATPAAAPDVAAVQPATTAAEALDEAAKDTTVSETKVESQK